MTRWCLQCSLLCPYSCCHSNPSCCHGRSRSSSPPCSSPRVVLLLLRSTSPKCRSHPEVVLHCCHDLFVLALVDVVLLLLLCAILALCSLVPSGQACQIDGMLCSCCFLFLLICCSPPTLLGVSDTKERTIGYLREDRG